MEKRKIQITLVAIGVLLIVLFFSCKRIDAGHAGIKVYSYGDNKGVSNVVQVTGWTFYNPISQRVFEVPTFVQTANYKLDSVNEINNELRFNTKDGMIVRMDASLNYSTPDSSVVRIFKKYRKPVPELENNILRNLVIEAMNQVCGDYTCEQVYEKRNELEIKARQHLKEFLGKEGFIVEQFVIIGELRLPPAVVHNINEKVNATQISLRKQQEVQQFVYDSQKNVAKAKGDSAVTMINAMGNANAITVEANAQAEANRKLSVTITDQLIKYKQADRWDGANPTTVVGGNAQVILPLNK